MLARLKFDIKVRVNEILDKLPNHVWSDGTTTFLDPAVGGGQFVIEIERRLRSAGCSIANIRSRVFGYEGNQMRLNYAINKHGLAGTYTLGEVEELKALKMKFNVVVGNPPYKNNLHLTFLKLSYELLADNGVGIIIHPASWLLNIPRPHHAWARKFADNHAKEFEFATSKSVFGDLVIMESVIAITMFTHSPRLKEQPIKIINHIDNITYDVNGIHEITPGNKIPNSLIKKIKSACASQGSLDEHIYTSYTSPCAGSWFVVTSNLTGNIDKKTNKPCSDFYTFISKTRARVVTSKDFYGPTRNPRFFAFNAKQDAENFLGYLKTDFARFCLSMEKDSRNLTKLSLKYTPWMDFTQAWDDDKLYQYLNIEQSEIDFITHRIPKYYDVD